MSVTAHNASTGVMHELAAHPVVQLVAARFQRANVELHLVGGCVRDALLGNLSFDDLDFASPAPVEVIARLLDPLGSVFDVGARFGTISCAVRTAEGFDKVEITQFRTEAYSADSRKPTVMAATTLHEDLVRRDLTINAVALRVSPGPAELVDPFNGEDDLRNGVLRTPGVPDETFTEDPLRIVRVVRFAARFGFTVDPATEAAAIRCADRLSIVAAERVTDELRKIMSLGPSATAQAMRHARRLNVAAALFGGLPCDEVTATAVEQLPESRLVLSLLALAAGDSASAALTKLKLSHDEADTARRTAQLVGELAGASAPEVRRLLRSDGELVADAITVAEAAGLDMAATAATVTAVLSTHPDISERALPVTGNDALAVGLKGKAVGDALRRVESAFLANPDLDRSSALALLNS